VSREVQIMRRKGANNMYAIPITFERDLFLNKRSPTLCLIKQRGGAQVVV